MVLNLKSKGIEACTSLFGRIDTVCEIEIIDKIYRGILTSISLLKHKYIKGDLMYNRLIILYNHFVQKLSTHTRKLEDPVVSNIQNNKKVTFVVGGKRKTKRRKTRTKSRNRRTKKVKH